MVATEKSIKNTRFFFFLMESYPMLLTAASVQVVLLP